MWNFPLFSTWIHPSLLEGEEILTRGKLHLSPFIKQNLHIPLDHLPLIATHE
jgi:hypothetical protein